MNPRLGGGLLVLLLAGCAGLTPQEQQGARTVLDTAQEVCVIANLVMDEAALKTACHITDELAPEFKKLLSASKTVAAQRSVGVCK